MAVQQPRAWKTPQLAQASGVSPAQIQNIMKGYRIVRAGETAPVVASAGDAARIARALGLSPVELEKAGRGDAAEVLRQIIAIEDDQGDATPLRRLIDIRGQIDALIEELRIGE